MYVNRGIGNIVAPVRLFCRPEIVEITLTRG
jgi:predicted MPP superfamily phosphohydrolase